MRVVALSSLLLVFEVTAAAAASAERGLNLARANCAQCHSIDKVTESPIRIAPPLRTLHERYPVEDLEKPLAEGIVSGHPNMPELRFDQDQIMDLIAFLKTLEKAR